MTAYGLVMCQEAVGNGWQDPNQWFDCLSETCFVAVSVRQIEWYDEDKRFAVGYSDGMVYLCSPDEYQQPIAIEAHQVMFTSIKKID